MRRFGLSLVARAFSIANSHSGSFRGTLANALKVYRYEGFSGLTNRIGSVFAVAAALPSSYEDALLSEALTFGRPPSKELEVRFQNVDVVICVHNSLPDVRRCLSSVLAATAPPYRLILVDDGSEPETQTYLSAFAEENGATLLRNETATGYTRAANAGLRASEAELVVLLNSDTIVSQDWLDRLVRCATSDRRIGIAGPLSNAASWQSVPKVTEKGDWANNPLPHDWSVSDFSRDLANLSPLIFPRVGFLNGFCLLIKRELMEDIGIFDEQTFDSGYGEENDYCLRATHRGWHLAVADDCFVFHAQSKSYSPERRRELSRIANLALMNKHGTAIVGRNLAITQNHPALVYMRERTEALLQQRRSLLSATSRYAGKRVLFLLPAQKAGGGGKVVVSEARAMRRLAVDAQIVNLAINRQEFERFYPSLGVPVSYVASPKYLTDLVHSFDAIVSTYYLTVYWLTRVSAYLDQKVLGYYIQDFEPEFFQRGSSLHQMALASYTKIEGMKVFTKTHWTARTLLNEAGVESKIVGPSVDADVYHPGPVACTPDVVRVLAMVRPSSPRRAPESTMRILRRLKERFGQTVEVSIFGVEPTNSDYFKYGRDFPHRCWGELDARGVAMAMSQADVFVDCSIFQAMGLTALEAMSTGVAVVGPKNGGLSEIISHGVNGLLADTSDEDDIFSAACRLVSNPSLRQKIRIKALKVVAHTPEMSAARILDVLFGDQAQT